jgi:hypothetical protein
MAALDLRPLSLGELLDRTFFLYRRHFLLFAGIAAIPYSLIFVVNLASTVFQHVARANVSGGVPTGAIVAAAATGGLIAFAALIAGAIAFLFSVGATVFAVSELHSGRQTTIRQSLQRVRGYAGTIFGVLFLSVLIMIGGFIALIIPAIYLMCRICVATPAALLEDLGPADSIRRSFHLTKDFAGRAFLIYLLYFAMSWGVIALFEIPFAFMVGLTAKQGQLQLFWTILMQIGNFLGSVLVAPVSTIGFALFYYDLRVRKEAFDLQMMMQAIGGGPVPPAPPLGGGVPSAFGRDAF